MLPETGTGIPATEGAVPENVIKPGKEIPGGNMEKGNREVAGEKEHSEEIEKKGNLGDRWRQNWSGRSAGESGLRR